MSTILKALKKLEQETQAAATLPVVETEPAAGPLPGRNRLWIGLGLGAGLLGLGLALFVLLRPAGPPAAHLPQGRPVPPAPPKTAKAPGDELPMPKVFPPRQPGEPETATAEHAPSTATQEYAAELKASAKAKAAASIRTVTQQHPPPSAAPPADRPAKAVSPQRTTAPPDPKPRAADTPVAAAPPPPPPAVQAPPSAQGDVSTAASSAGSTPPAAPAPAPEQPPAAAEKQASPAADTVEAAVDPFANVPPLEANSPIDLQAISWAESAAQRIAVINNVVLHEGDSVEGYFVVQIRPDDVVLRREGRMWRANFAIR